MSVNFDSNLLNMIMIVVIIIVSYIVVKISDGNSKETFFVAVIIAVVLYIADIASSLILGIFFLMFSVFLYFEFQSQKESNVGVEI